MVYISLIVKRKKDHEKPKVISLFIEIFIFLILCNIYTVLVITVTQVNVYFEVRQKVNLCFKSNGLLDSKLLYFLLL